MIAGGEKIYLKPQDGVSLRANWLPAVVKKSAVIIFPGNGVPIEENEYCEQWFSERKFSVLSIALRENWREMELYFDVEATMDFLKRQGFSRENILVYGFSLGGALAAAAGYYYGVTIILDHTFTTGADAANSLIKFVPKPIVNSIVKKYLPADQYSVVFRTDGLNTLEKVERMKADLLIVYGLKDKLMPVSFAEKLNKARYKNDRSHLIAVPGEHTSSFKNFPEAEKRVEEFLREKGLLNPL